MALKKPTSFEQEPEVVSQGDVATAEAAAAPSVAPDTPTVNPETQPEAKTMNTATETQDTTSQAAQAAVTTAVAVAKASTSTTSVALADAAAKAKEFQKEVTAMKGASDFSFGNYRVFKGNNGSIAESGGEEEDLGRWAQVRLLSWDEHTEISPGEQGASSKDFVAYSKDGKTIDSVIGEELRTWVGSSVSAYLDYLKKEEEFPNAKARLFVDTACALMATDSGDGPVGTVIQVTLSESSIPAFSRYQQSLVDTARCVSMGLPGFKLPEDPFQFFFLREVAAKGSNKWTKLKIVSTLPAKI